MPFLAGKQAFLDLLKQEGVDLLFGNPGTTELPLMDGLAREKGIRYILTLQEGVAIAAARPKPGDPVRKPDLAPALSADPGGRRAAAATIPARAVPGDLDLALRGLLGVEVPLSPGSIARLRGKGEAEYRAWKERSLTEPEVVSLWADGIYVKAGWDRDKTALLVVLGALRDGTKVLRPVESSYRESTEAGAPCCGT